MFNKVIVAGNLTRDPELKYLTSGTAICNTGIAINRKFKKQDGTQADEVCFIDVSFFGRTAEVVNQYLKKGSKVLLEGRLKQDTWTDQTGQKKSRHTIVAESMQMIGAKNDDAGATEPEQPSTATKGAAKPKKDNTQPQVEQIEDPNIPEIDLAEEEIPF